MFLKAVELSMTLLFEPAAIDEITFDSLKSPGHGLTVRLTAGGKLVQLR